MRRVKSFQPPARAVLPESLAFVPAQAEKTCGVPEHDLIDLIVVISHRSQEQSHDVGEWLRRKQLRKTVFLPDHRPVGAVEQPLITTGEAILERLHAFENLLAGSNPKDLAERADVRIGISIRRTGDDLPDRPFPAFVDVVHRAAVSDRVVEMPEMSHVDAQPSERVLLEDIAPKCRVRAVFIVGIRPEAMAGMSHDRHVVRAAPRVELCERCIELATDLRSEPRLGRAQISRFAETLVRQALVADRPKSHGRVQFDPDEPAGPPTVALDGSADERHWILVSRAAPMIVVERLSQRTETDEAMHPGTVLAASEPRHRLDLISHARMVIVLAPFGKIDGRGRHQHDPRLLPDLAVQLIQLFSQSVAIARIEER